MEERERVVKVLYNRYVNSLTYTIQILCFLWKPRLILTELGTLLVALALSSLASLKFHPWVSLGVYAYYRETIPFSNHILTKDTRFVHGIIKDTNYNHNWLVTFLYGYPHHHLQKELWKRIVNIPDKTSKPWVILGNFNKLSCPDEKISFLEVILLDMLISISL